MNFIIDFIVLCYLLLLSWIIFFYLDYEDIWDRGYFLLLTNIIIIFNII